MELHFWSLALCWFSGKLFSVSPCLCLWLCFGNSLPNPLVCIRTFCLVSFLLYYCSLTLKGPSREQALKSYVIIVIMIILIIIMIIIIIIVL